MGIVWGMDGLFTGLVELYDSPTWGLILLLTGAVTLSGGVLMLYRRRVVLLIGSIGMLLFAVAAMVSEPFVSALIVMTLILSIVPVVIVVLALRPRVTLWIRGRPHPPPAPFVIHRPQR